MRSFIGLEKKTLTAKGAKDGREGRQENLGNAEGAEKIFFHGGSLESDCGAGEEGGPVDSFLKVVVWREGSFESEGEFGGAVGLEVRDSLLGFVDAGTVSGGNPPEGGVSAGEF